MCDFDNEFLFFVHTFCGLLSALRAFIFMVSWMADIAKMQSENMLLHWRLQCEWRDCKTLTTYLTLGRPTTPIFNAVPNLPISGGGFGASLPFL